MSGSLPILPPHKGGPITAQQRLRAAKAAAHYAHDAEDLRVLLSMLGLLGDPQELFEDPPRDAMPTMSAHGEAHSNGHSERSAAPTIFDRLAALALPDPREWGPYAAEAD